MALFSWPILSTVLTGYIHTFLWRQRQTKEACSLCVYTAARSLVHVDLSWTFCNSRYLLHLELTAHSIHCPFDSLYKWKPYYCQLSLASLLSLTDKTEYHILAGVLYLFCSWFLGLIWNRQFVQVLFVFWFYLFLFALFLLFLSATSNPLTTISSHSSGVSNLCTDFGLFTNRLTVPHFKHVTKECFCLLPKK